MELPIILAVIVLVLIAFGVRIVSQYEKAVVFTLGKFSRILEPGFNVIVPFIQRSTKVDIRERAVDVPSQDAITKDNISLNVNAVIYYKIDDVAKSIINVRSLEYAIMQFAMTTMRNSIGQFDLDELLSKREEAGKKIMEIVENKSQEWWVNILSVEIKDINLPDELKRTIGKQAEAEREKRAKIIDAEGELIASEKLSEAAAKLAAVPGALHLRTLQSINDISSDQSNTTIWMVPVEALKALEGITQYFQQKK